VNENLEPDEGDGVINDSPPPPLLNENADLDGDVYGVDRNDGVAFAAFGFVCVISSSGLGLDRAER
jgi:hypothetical protein